MPVDINILKKNSFFKHFSEKELETIAQKAVISQHNPNHTLFNYGDNDGMTAFLLLGEVELKSADGQTQTIKPSDLCLADLKPRKYTAKTSKHGTCILWVDDKLINRQIKKEEAFQQIPTIQMEYIQDRRQTPRSKKSLIA